MLARVSRLLSVRPSEVSFVGLSALLVMSAMAVNVLVLGTVTALFLATSTRAQLPLVYAAGAGFGMLASAVLTQLASRVSRSREIAAVMSVLGVGLLVAFSALPYAPHGFLFGVHPVATGLSALVVMQSFALINDCLDAEQAKRLLPTIGAGGTLGAMGAGAAMAWLAPRFGADRGLVLAAALAFVAAVLARRLVKIHLVTLGSAIRAPGALAALIAEHTAPKVKPLDALRRSSLLRRLAILQLLVLAGSTCLKFCLESALQAQLGVDHIARFLGLLNVVANGAVLIVQTSLEARVLRRFGLWFGLAAMPVLLLCGGSLLIVSSSLTALAVVRFGETVSRFSVARTAEDLVMLPLPSSLRRPAKTLLASTVMPVSVLLGSLLILSVDAYGRSLAYVVTFLLGLSALVVVRSLRSPYLEHLREKLAHLPSAASRSTRVPAEMLQAGAVDAVVGTEGSARMQLLRTLRRHRLHGAAFTLPKRTLVAELAVELQVGHRLRLLRAAVARAELSVLQKLAVERELQFQEDRVHLALFSLLALTYAADDIHRAELSHARGDRRVRAFALEVLNQVVDAGVRANLMPYLAGATPEEQRQNAASALGLAQGSDLRALLRDDALPRRLRPLAMYLSCAVARDPQETTLMSTLDQTFVLRGTELFSRLSPEELQALAEISEPRSVTQGERVFAEGDAGDAFYVVLSGELQVTRGGSKVAVLKQGECFGEMALLDQGVRTATVTASSDCQLSRIGDEDFRDLLERTPRMAMGMLTVLARRAASLLERMPRS